MMKHAKSAFVALCAAALCWALGGCAGVSQSETAAFAGTWNLVEMSQAGEVTGSDELGLMNALGMEVTFELAEDGTAVLDTLGKKSTGTWTASSETEGTATIDGQEIAITISEAKLTIEQGGDKMVFEKVADAVSKSSSAAASSGSGDSAGSSGSAGSKEAGSSGDQSQSSAAASDQAASSASAASTGGGSASSASSSAA